MLDRAPRRSVTPALEARDVSVRRCGTSLVQRVSLTADRGELLVLLGGQGSGTCTMLSLLAGRAVPDAGKILLDGRSPLHLADAGDLVVGEGPVDADAVLRGHCSVVVPRGRVVLLDRPLDGLAEQDANALLARCRASADAGDAVVVTIDSAALAARHATTIALFVAGRLLSWGPPAIALVPALQLLGTGASLNDGVAVPH